MALRLLGGLRVLSVRQASQGAAAATSFTAKKTAAAEPDARANSMDAIDTLLVPRMARPLPPLTREELLKRMRMAKAYSRYAMHEHNRFHKRVCEVARCRNDAMEELRRLSPTLYAAACVPDETPFPIRMKPPTETPPPALVGASLDPAARARNQALEDFDAKT